jgi:hypothetical protein
LSLWTSGGLSASAVRAWAVERYAVSGCVPQDEVVNEVLGLLDALDVNLTTVEDVPALRRLLSAEPTDLEAARRTYDAHVEAVDFGERKRRLSADPVYRRFCL